MPGVFKVRSVDLYGLWRAFSGSIKIKTIFIIILKYDLSFHSVERCTHCAKAMVSKMCLPTNRCKSTTLHWCPLYSSLPCTCIKKQNRRKQTPVWLRDTCEEAVKIINFIKLRPLTTHCLIFCMMREREHTHSTSTALQSTVIIEEALLGLTCRLTWPPWPCNSTFTWKNNW